MIWPRDLTYSGWAVVVTIMLLIATCVMGLSGCAAAKAEPAAGPLSIPGPIVSSGAPPPEIPAAAVVYRAALLRAWEHYFDLAEPAAIGLGQVHQESRWKADARSPVGASGLGQFMPATAEWIHGMLPADIRAACPVKSGCPNDPGWAIAALARFDYWLWSRSTWTATSEDRWGASLAGYNAGAGWVSRERAACAARPGCDASRWFGHIDTVCLRAPVNCRETTHYADVILHRWAPLYDTWLGY